MVDEKGETEGAGQDSTSQPEDFAQLVAAEAASPAQEPAAGGKVTGTIVQIGENEAFVDCGGRSELPLPIRELQNDKGEIIFKVGDRITAWVKVEGEQRSLTFARQVRGRDTRPIEEAQASGMPLEGTVKETNKGGFVIDLGGHRAFCPISQIDAHYVEDPTRYVGQTYKFRVTEFSGGGRNIVVSRRSLLKEEASSQAAETRRTLAVGDVRDGVVTRLMTFGAFVDIGGIEGLVHVSEISHDRVESPTAVLQPGQAVRVKVIGIQNLGQGKQERVSLSIKALSGDPWQDVARALSPGQDAAGRVRRLMEYGAFIELLPGVQGLIHISELSDQRIRHPREVVQEGEEVTVRVLDIDPARKRISLSLKQAGGGEHAYGEQREPDDDQG